MSIPLFDVQTGFGGFTPGKRVSHSPEALVAELSHARIEQALARITPDKDDFDIEHSNSMLYAACRKHACLIPCPVVAPDTVGDLGGAEAQVDSAIANGAAAAALRPGPDYWLPEPWVCQDIMDALAARALPAFCAERLVPMQTLAKMAEAFPNTTFIFAEINYRSLRTLLPLMKHFQNIYLSTGNNFTFHAGMELFAHHIGTERLLFGTGLPAAEAGAALGHLMYSSLTQAQKEDIGCNNFNRLRKGIRK